MDYFFYKLQAASIEESVPRHHRLKWTFADETERVNKPGANEGKESASRNRHRGGVGGNGKKRAGRALSDEIEDAKQSGSGKRKRGKGSASDTDTSTRSRRSSGSTKDRSPEGYGEPSERDQLVCQLIRRMDEEKADIPLGVITLPSQKRASFADVRRCIKQDLTTLPVEWAWRFWVPGFGTVSMRQESKFGSILSFYWKYEDRAVVGAGTLDDPINVILVDAPKD